MCWRLSFAAQAMRRESDIRAHPLQTCDALRPQDPTLISWMGREDDGVAEAPARRGREDQCAVHVLHRLPSRLNTSCDAKSWDYCS